MSHDLIGRRFGRLVVISKSDDAPKGRPWECLCDCGKTAFSSAYNLNAGKTKSCGCYRLSVLRSANFKHGLSHTKTHSIWKGVLKRCDNKACAMYPHYGGRGITVCDRWREFENFVADMGECPSAQHSIERLDVNGNYEPENCIWLPVSMQVLNTRRTKQVTINGETKPLHVWCNEAGLRYGLVYDRIKRLGWDAQRALREPPNA